MKKEPEKLLFDANVLIDLLNSDFNILKDVKTYVAEIYVLREILENEVPELTKQACHDVGLVIIKPKEHVTKESETKIGPLTIEDQLNLYTTIDSGFSLVTNDKNLRKALYNVRINAA